jgi:hypothetical protein
MKFDYSIAMGIRYGDNQRKEQLETLIDKNFDKIQAIITEHHVPLLPIPKKAAKKEND